MKPWFFVLTVLFLSGGFSEARPLLLGDWESSGGRPYIYTPLYPYSYHCQVEISDEKSRRENGRDVILFAVAEFDLNQQQPLLKTDNFAWRWVSRDIETGQLRKIVRSGKSPVAKPPFKITGHFVWLTFQPNLSGPEELRQETDAVTLSLSLELQIFSRFVGKTESRNGLRSDKSLRVTNWFGSRDEQGQWDQHLTARVMCDKRE